MSELLHQENIPTEDDLRLIINSCDFADTSYPPLFLNELGTKAPVLGTFEVTQIPRGFGVPLVVRQEWVGLSLPVRCKGTDFVGAVPILAVEALEELKGAGRTMGHEWWRREYEADWKNTPAYNPNYPNALLYSNFLVFSEEEGEMRLVVPPAEPKSD